MVGNAASLGAYYLVLAGLALWMVVKIARESKALALATLFVWPLSIIALVRNWGQPDTDIRVPFFLAVLTLGLFLNKAQSITADPDLEAQAVEFYAGLNYSDSELDEIAQGNPEFVAKVREAMRAAEAPERDTSWQPGEESYTEFSEFDSVVSRPVVLAEDVPQEVVLVTRPAVPPSAVLARQTGPAVHAAARQLSFRFATVPLEAANASVRLPAGFRFVPRYRLPQFARLIGRPLDQHSLGWVVHESVDLAAESAWYVEVEFLRTGLLETSSQLELQLPELAGAALQDGTERVLGRDLLAPNWLADPGIATWGVLTGPPEAESADILAAVPLRHGVLLYLMRSVDSERFELGLRATRLLALRTQVERLGQPQNFDPRRDPAAGIDLFAWIRGEPLPASPARG